MEKSKEVIAAEISDKEQANGKARFTAYMQCVKKLEMKARMQKEAEMKGGAQV